MGGWKLVKLEVLGDKKTLISQYVRNNKFYKDISQRRF